MRTAEKTLLKDKPAGNVEALLERTPGLEAEGGDAQHGHAYHRRRRADEGAPMLPSNKGDRDDQPKLRLVGEERKQHSGKPGTRL